LLDTENELSNSLFLTSFLSLFTVAASARGGGVAVASFFECAEDYRCRQVADWAIYLLRPIL